MVILLLYFAGELYRHYHPYVDYQM